MGHKNQCLALLLGGLLSLASQDSFGQPLGGDTPAKPPAVAEPVDSKTPDQDQVNPHTDAAAQGKRALELLRRLEKVEQNQVKGKKQQEKIESLEQENAELKARMEALESFQTELSIAEQTKLLQIYGWMDLNFNSLIGVDENHNLEGHLPSQSMFTVGHLNLILDVNPSDKWRALVETRFTFSPDGYIESYELAGLIPFHRWRTEIFEIGTTMETYRWGGVAIDRAWLQWAPRDYLKITFGQFFTPFGIWNLDHGTPALISITPPMMLTLEVFPMFQTGLKLEGEFHFGTEHLNYVMTLSNGRIAISNTDLDENKAIGGRLVFTTERLGELKVGLSGYYGRYSDDKLVLDLNKIVEPPILPRIDRQYTVQFDEVIFGADVQWDYEGFGMMSEVTYSSTTFVDPYRPPANINPFFETIVGLSTHPLADFAMLSIYGMLYYQLPWLDLRPFVRADWMDANDNIRFDDLLVISGGLNYRPVSRIALKVELYQMLYPNKPEYSVNQEFLNGIKRNYMQLAFQAALSF